jgi:transcription elongation factor GreB
VYNFAPQAGLGNCQDFACNEFFGDLPEPMSKAFTKETDHGNDDHGEADALPAQPKNYVTPFGLGALKDELRQLAQVERPEMVEVVAWAAGNGDRSENGDYLYGKKRLREIDRRIRYLTKRIEGAVVVDPAQQSNLKQVFFGATVRFVRGDGTEQTVKITGVDEAEFAQGKISWLSPVARALMKAQTGDAITIRTPSGNEEIEVLEIHYGAS